MKRNPLIPLALIPLLWMVCGPSQALVYEAPVTESEWVFKGNRVACSIEHTIPSYGTARFEQLAGQSVSFRLTVDPLKPAIRTAQLQAIPPSWMHDGETLDLHTVKHSKPSYKIALQGEVVEIMLQSLSQGRFPQFRYAARKGGGRETRVAISSINFLEAAERFDACREGLLPFSHESLNGSLVLFERGRSDLPPRTRQKLRDVVTFIKESPAGTRLELVNGAESFSVKLGQMRYNERLGEVRDFLLANGLDDSQITILNRSDDEITPPGSVRLGIAGPEPFQLIYFHSGSKALSKRDKRKLDYMLKYMRDLPLSGTVVLRGHTDSKGPRYGNLALSKKRVAVIRNYLISQGLSPRRIKTKAYGESQPVTTNRFPSGRELNRRVAIEVHSG